MASNNNDSKPIGEPEARCSSASSANLFLKAAPCSGVSAFNLSTNAGPSMVRVTKSSADKTSRAAHF